MAAARWTGGGGRDGAAARGGVANSGAGRAQALSGRCRAPWRSPPAAWAGDLGTGTPPRSGTPHSADSSFVGPAEPRFCTSSCLQIPGDPPRPFTPSARALRLLSGAAATSHILEEPYLCHLRNPCAPPRPERASSGWGRGRVPRPSLSPWLTMKGTPRETPIKGGGEAFLREEACKSSALFIAQVSLFG